MTNEPNDPLDLPPIKIISTVEDGDLIEKKHQEQSLEHDNNLKILLIKEIKQRILIRWIAFFCTVFVMVLMAIFSYFLIFSPYAMPREHFILSTPSYLTVAAIVAPIMSISVICITILLGAFRKPTEKEDGNINMTSLAAQALKSSINS